MKAFWAGWMLVAWSIVELAAEAFTFGMFSERSLLV